MAFLSSTIGSWCKLNKVENQDVNIGNKSVYPHFQTVYVQKNKWYYTVDKLSRILSSFWLQKKGIP